MIPLTRSEGFFSIGGRPLASVNSGIPAVEALERASCILSAVVDLATNAVDEGVLGAEAFAIQCLAEVAKALVDAAATGELAGEGSQ